MQFWFLCILDHSKKFWSSLLVVGRCELLGLAESARAEQTERSTDSEPRAGERCRQGKLSLHLLGQSELQPGCFNLCLQEDHSFLLCHGGRHRAV